MSEEELKIIKEEIKRELLNELTEKKVVKDDIWKKLKNEFNQMFYSKGYIDKRERMKIFDGISTIARTSMGYRNVASIPIEKEEELRQIMFKILNIYPKKGGD